MEEKKTIILFIQRDKAENQQNEMTQSLYNYMKSLLITNQKAQIKIKAHQTTKKR